MALQIGAMKKIKVYTTRGNIVRYDRGKVIKRKPVDAKYSHCEYTSKVSKKIK